MFFDIYFRDVIASEDFSENFKGLYAISTKENFYYYLDKGEKENQVLVEIKEGKIKELFKKLIPKQEQIQNIFSKVSKFLQKFGADKIYMKLLSDEGLDICDDVAINLSDKMQELAKYYSIRQHYVTSNEEKYFLSSKESKDSQIDFMISSIKRKNSLESNQEEETYYNIIKKISNNFYFNIIVHFDTEINIKNEIDMHLSCFMGLLNYLEEVINEIDEIYR